MKKLLIVTSLCLFSFSSSAADALGGFSAKGGISWGMGKMKNESGSIKERDTNMLELAAMPGYRFWDVLVAPYLSYRSVGQNTEPSEVNNQNLKGSGYLIGLGSSYTYEMVSFTGAVSFLGQHKLSNKDLSNNEVTYKKPFGIHLGVDLMLSRWFKPLDKVDFAANLNYSSVKYKEDQVGTSVADVDKDKRSQTNIALGISAFY